jgi:iron complex transport system substrate-binding protein
MPPRPARLAAVAAALLAVVLTGAPAAGAAAAPKRVVALTPFTANITATLGVKPVAIGETLGGNEHYSSSLAKVKRLPLSHPNGPNMEQLALLEPDLVLSSPTWRKGATTMRQLQIKVAESDPQSVADVAVQTRRIGALLGRAKQADRLADRQQAHIAAAKKRGKTHPTVLLVLGVGRTPYAFLKNSWGGDVVTQAGGRLLTGNLRNSGGFARISNEFVVRQNPDIIIAVPHGNAQDIEGLAKFLADNPAWQDTDAVRNKRLYVSTDNALLQAWTTAATSIYDVQRQYLRNQ